MYDDLAVCGENSVNPDQLAFWKPADLDLYTVNRSAFILFLKIYILYTCLLFRPTLKIVLFPLTRPCFTGMGRSVGKLFFLFLKLDTHLTLCIQ